jgi:hypothetical protein
MSLILHLVSQKILWQVRSLVKSINLLSMSLPLHLFSLDFWYEQITAGVICFMYSCLDLSEWVPKTELFKESCFSCRVFGLIWMGLTDRTNSGVVWFIYFCLQLSEWVSLTELFQNNVFHIACVCLVWMNLTDEIFSQRGNLFLYWHL